jgi:hypothetical protein
VTRPAVRLWYAVLVAICACVVVAGTSVWYADHTQRQQQRQWCELMISLDDAYRATPPTTKIGQNVASEIRRLRNAFGCS